MFFVLLKGNASGNKQRRYIIVATLIACFINFFSLTLSSSHGEGQIDACGGIFARESLFATGQCNCHPITSLEESILPQGKKGVENPRRISVDVSCKGSSWRALPNFTVSIQTPSSLKQHRFLVVSFRSTDGNLESLAQDAFRSVFQRRVQLQSVDLSGNELTAHGLNANAFRGLEDTLSVLDLSRNRLDRVPSWALSSLHNLGELRLTGNLIQAVDNTTFADCRLPALQVLQLDGNRLGTLPKGTFRGLSALKVLTLGENRLETVEEGALPEQLELLDLRNNFLREIPYGALQNLTQLRLLNLEGNNISYLFYRPPPFHPRPPSLTSVKKLPSFRKEPKKGADNESENRRPPLDLLLGNNRIRRLGEFAFDGFKRLNRLDLCHNKISYVNEKAFRPLLSLVELDLCSNSVYELPEGIFTQFAKTLTRLNLEGNALTALPAALRPLEVLERLNFNRNHITDINGEFLAKSKASLLELHLSANNLTRIPTALLHGASKLRTLDLSKNRIERIEKMAFGTFDGSGAGPHFPVTSVSNGSGESGTGGGSPLIRVNLAGNRLREIVSPGAFLYLSRLRVLDLSENELWRLAKSSFQRLESLEWLSLSGNQLSEFPRNVLSALPRLRHLFLDKNQLTSLPNYAFQWLDRLEHLSLARNKIQVLNEKIFHASSAGKLRSLDLAGNNLKQLPTGSFSELPQLESLRLEHNHLAKIHQQAIASLPRLKKLSLAHNRLHSIQPKSIVSLPELSVLSFSHNKLKTIEKDVFEKLPVLTHLDLSHNQLATMDTSFLEGAECSDLHRLDLSWNNIRRLSDLSLVRHSLRRLDASHNQLEVLVGGGGGESSSSSASSAFAGFRRLEVLDLSHNDLLEVPPNAFSNNTQLREVNLSENNLRSLWRGTFKDQILLDVVDLSGNALQSLTIGVFGGNNVRLLDLTGNNLNSFPEKALSSISGSLQELRLGGNQIRAIERSDFRSLINLTALDLSENAIEVLEDRVFEPLISLRKLVLSGNPLNTVSPSAFMSLSPSLEVLELARNELFSVPRIIIGSNGNNDKKQKSRLRQLNLSGNRLETITAGDFDGLSFALQTLDLSDNQLVGPPSENLFEGFQAMRTLNLSGNRFHSLDAFLGIFQHLEQLETLNISNLHELGDRSSVAPSTPSTVSSSTIINLEINENQNNKLIEQALTMFAPLRQLKHLYMSDFPSLLPSVQNNLTLAVLRILPPLESLYLEWKGTNLGSELLALADTRKLRELQITGREITEVSESAFRSLRGYRIRLSLRGTRLKRFPAAELFSRLANRVSLLELDLRGNQLETLELISRSKNKNSKKNTNSTNTDRTKSLLSAPPMLDWLDLRDNPLRCDCRLAWLSDWIHERRHRFETDLLLDAENDSVFAAKQKRWRQQRTILEETKCALDNNQRDSGKFDGAHQTASNNLFHVYSRSKIVWRRRNAQSSSSSSSSSAIENDNADEVDDNAHESNGESERKEEKEENAKVGNFVNSELMSKKYASSSKQVKGGEKKKKKHSSTFFHPESGDQSKSQRPISEKRLNRRRNAPVVLVCDPDTGLLLSATSSDSPSSSVLGFFSRLFRGDEQEEEEDHRESDAQNSTTKGKATLAEMLFAPALVLLFGAIGLLLWRWLIRQHSSGGER